MCLFSKIFIINIAQAYSKCRLFFFCCQFISEFQGNQNVQLQISRHFTVLMKLTKNTWSFQVVHRQPANPCFQKLWEGWHCLSQQAGHEGTCQFMECGQLGNKRWASQDWLEQFTFHCPIPQVQGKSLQVGWASEYQSMCHQIPS